LLVAQQRRQRPDGIFAADDSKLPAGVDPSLQRSAGISDGGDQLGFVGFGGTVCASV